MAPRDIIQVIEIDIDQCTLTWGVGACPASLSTANVRKCYNSWATCPVRQAYNKGTNTLRFINGGQPIKGQNYLPSLVSVSGYEQEVNIAGFTPDIGGLGKRASINVVMEDFQYNDFLTDKYQSERVSGAAQNNEGGYNPLNRGSFWSKFKARNPNYGGRPLRVINGYFNGSGGFTAVETRNYVMSEIDGPGSDGRVTIKAKDILALADNEKAKAPVQNNGRLLNDINETQTTATLSPAGIGNAEYPASGVATIGSEIVRFTRVNNTLTIERGVLGTQASRHSASDSVQLAYRATNQRADVVIRDLLINYAGIPSSYIPFGQWQAEFSKWGSSLVLNSCICKPTGVTKLLEEITQLGITIWWDEVDQLIKLKLNHPNEDPEKPINDRNAIIKAEISDNDSDRATRIAFWTVQIDPTKDLSPDNFLRGYYQVALEEESPDAYNQVITKTILCRWLNQGNESATKIISGRLLNRYRTAPITYSVTIDSKDDIRLSDVVTLEHMGATDVTGRVEPKLTQVFYRGNSYMEGKIDLKLQAFQYAGTYGVFTENSRPVYGSSTQAQKEKGTYWVGPSLVFADGRRAYQFV